MRTKIAAMLLAAMPLFSQFENPCISAEDRHAQFRADNSRPFSFPQGPSPTGTKTPTAEECLASAQRTKPEPKPGGAISFYNLTHKIPAKARKEFEKGVTSGIAGDYDSAVIHYRNAIKFDPGYLAAHNNLGARLMVNRKWKEAIEEFELARHLDPRSSPVHSNLGVLYLELHDYEKAELEGLLASTLDPTSGKPHFVVGMAMLYQAKDSRMAKAHLLKASVEVPASIGIIEKLGL